jgi:hypothetical protein
MTQDHLEEWEENQGEYLTDYVNFSLAFGLAAGVLLSSPL